MKQGAPSLEAAFQSSASHRRGLSVPAFHLRFAFLLARHLVSANGAPFDHKVTLTLSHDSR